MEMKEQFCHKNATELPGNGICATEKMVAHWPHWLSFPLFFRTRFPPCRPNRTRHFPTTNRAKTASLHNHSSFEPNNNHSISQKHCPVVGCLQLQACKHIRDLPAFCFLLTQQGRSQLLNLQKHILEERDTRATQDDSPRRPGPKKKQTARAGMRQRVPPGVETVAALERGNMSVGIYFRPKAQG